MNEFLAQLTHRQGINCVVNRLVTDVGIFKFRKHTAQVTGNLLRGEAVTEHFLDHLEQLTAWHQFTLGTTSDPASLRVLVGTIGGVVAISITIAPNLPADGGWRAL